MHYKSLVAAAIITSLSHTALADTLAPISAVQDTWTNGSGAGSGSNYGTQTTFRIDTGKMRGFIQFTVTGIPAGHTVDTAILTLTAQGNKSGNIPDTFVAAVTNAPVWDQTTLTDLNDDDLLAATGDAVASATDIAVGATADFDIAAAINGNGTYTFMINIADADARATKYYSNEAEDEAVRPILNITTVASDPSDTAPPETTTPDTTTPEPTTPDTPPIEGNTALTLTLTQAGSTIATISTANADAIPYIDATKGLVTVSVDVSDSDSDDEDTHTIAWTNSSDDLGAASENFEFSPLDLSGDFTLSVSAIENDNAENLLAQLTAKIRIIKEGFPELVADIDSDGDGTNDTEEGFNDSDGDGIVDYLDDNANTAQLPLAADQKSLQTLGSLTLSLGSISTSAQGVAAKSAIITQEQLTSNVADGSSDTTDSYYSPIEGVSLFNFTVSGLANDGDTVPVVYPLPKGVLIGEETKYRKYTQEAGWTTFVSDAENSIASTVKDDLGNCPAPNSELYIDGLTTGDSCIQLTIKDGGIYDADGIENSSIEDPGVLANPSNSAPKLAEVELTPASRNEAYSTSIAELITDADGDAYTVSKVGGPYWLKVSETGELSGTPLKANIGDNKITIKLTDDRGATNETTFTVVVSDSTVRASSGGSFSAGLLTLLGLLSLRRKKAQK